MVAAGVAGVYAFRGANGSAPDNRIVVSGNIELTEVNIAFKTAGRLIERTVDEGDAVKKGQVIARLDRDQLMAAARARGRRPGVGANRNWRRPRPRSAWQKATLAADIEQRKRRPGVQRGAPGRAEERLAAAGEAGRPGRRGLRAQSEVERAKQDWDRAQALYKNDDISTAQFDQYRNRWESAAAALKSGQGARRRWCWPVRAWKRSTRSRRRWSARAARCKMARGQRARNETARAGTGHAARRNRALAAPAWR